MPDNIPTTRLVPVTQWPEVHPWPSVAGLRHLIHFEKDNGFDAVVRRIGRRVLIDEAAFFAWADSVSAPKKNTRQKAKNAAGGDSAKATVALSQGAGNE